MTASRPLWLVTLADLALLLLGFMLLLHATGEGEGRRRAEIGAGIRDAFGGGAAARPAVGLPLDLNATAPFLPDSELLPSDAAALADWAAEAMADPRSRLVVTGEAEPAEGLALAGRRAAALADMLAADRRLDPARMRLDAHLVPGGRRATLSISFDP